MMRPIRLMLAATLIAATALPGLAQEAMSAAAPEAAQSSPFSAEERGALHGEIRSYLLEHPEIIMEMIQILEDKKQQATAEVDRDLVAENHEAIFDDGFSWVGGNPEATFTIVEFLDYQCGFCRKAQPDVQALLKADGDIRLIVKEMPILGPGSELAAKAAVATLVSQGPEKYQALHELLMTSKGPIDDTSLDATLVQAGLDPATIRAAMQDPEVERQLDATRSLAETLAIAGTPTFVFDNRMVRGYIPLDQMRELVAALRVDN